MEDSMGALLKSKRYKRYELYDKKMEARSNGLKEYNTGEPCKNGHTSNRSTTTNRCLECERLLQIRHGGTGNHWYRLKKYKITSKQWDEMLESQQGKCTLCLTKFDLQNRPVIDHCHITEEVRSLLCNACNSMLGFAKDNPETLKAGVKYLELFKE
jgi:hypothetical protein